jgi:hypothetical protein
MGASTPRNPAPTYAEQQLLDFAGRGSKSVPTNEYSSSSASNIVRKGSNNPESSGNGTVNFLGSSYSGADIEILATVRNTKALEFYVEEAQRNLDELNTEWTSLGEQIVSSTDKNRISLTNRYAVLRDQITAATLQWDERKKDLSRKFALIPLATAQSLSVQVFREKYAVRALGFCHSKGTSKGPRTVAGTIVFTSFDEHALAPFLAFPANTWIHEQIGTVPLIDQLPPMTITIRFSNEYGSISEMGIYGVEFVDDGQVMSIQDIFSENTCSFIAQDYDPMLRRGSVNWDRVSRGKMSEAVLLPESGSTLLTKNHGQYLDYQYRLGLKRNPYG